MDWKKAIQDFAQNTLGCGCPEEVFRQIEAQAEFPLGGSVRVGRITIGNRLLIYISEAGDEKTLASLLLFLVKEGKAERDRLRFNRFRLVLATDKDGIIAQKARSLFETIEKDERVHLHTIEKSSIPPLS